MLAGIEALGLDADILFIDDSSSDGTGELLDDLARSRARLFVVHRPAKLGIGSAHLDGIRWAFDQGYQTLVTMDCDFSHSPSDIPRMIEAVRGVDVAVASRYLRENSLPGWNPLRRLLTHSGHLLTRSMLGMEYDATGAFRVYDLRTVPRQLFEIVKSSGYSFFFESLFLMHVNGMRIREVPVVLPARTYGSSKMSLREALRSAKRVTTTALANFLDPAQFRIPRPIDGEDSATPTEWDTYWESSQKKTSAIYGILATVYRRLVITRNLTRALRRDFPAGSRLLHAGCGSGQVDEVIRNEMRITAVDISLAALRLYSRNNPRAERVMRASVFSLPFPDGEFDGAYNLGVIEHFASAEIRAMLGEMRRVVKPGGSIVIFWPHARGTSVLLLRFVHWMLNDVLRRGIHLHPPEISHVKSRKHAESVLRDAGLRLAGYEFGIRDGFVQAVVVAESGER